MSDENENENEKRLDETGEAVTSTSQTEVSQDEPSKLSGALKGYFYTPRHGDIRGAFCLLFDDKGDILESLLWVTRDMAGADIDIMADWRTVNKSIPGMGAYEKSLGERLGALLLDVFTPAIRTELLESAETSKQLEDFTEKLRDAFERATHCFLEINIRLECLSYQNLVEAGVLPTAEDAPAAAAAEKDTTFMGTLIACLPIIDPVRGKPVSELVPGDMVNVKIQSGGGGGDLIQKYLTSTDQEAIFPVEAVEKKEDGKIYVLLNINEEVRGFITVTKDLRLKVAYSASSNKRTIAININMDDVILFGTLGMALSVILLVVRFLLF